MTMVLAICVAVVFTASVYLLLSRELKAVAMGVFLLGHAANLCVLAQSGEPVVVGDDGLLASKRPPILGQGESAANPLATLVDPLPQALILTAIVISFGVMAFVLTLLVVTSRAAETLDTHALALLEDVDVATPLSAGERPDEPHPAPEPSAA
ncbi:MAG: NADH-quinone oxidoreductase subunit K [Planctomycetota bacterium]